MDFVLTSSSTLPARSRRWVRIGGAWLEASIDYSTTKSDLFDLALSLRAADGPISTPILQERFGGLSTSPADPRYAVDVLARSRVVELATLLDIAGERPLATPTRAARRRSKSPWRRKLATVFTLLVLLFPGVAFVPAAFADDGDGDVGGQSHTDTPTSPVRDPDPPPSTTTTDTTADEGESARGDGLPLNTAPLQRSAGATEPIPPTGAYPQYDPKRAPDASTGKAGIGGAQGTGDENATETTPAEQPGKDGKAGAAGTGSAAGSILTVPGLLPDPTPPSLRLKQPFAVNLAAAAARAHVDWALMLGVIRARGAAGSAPAAAPALDALAARLSRLGANRHPERAALTLVGGKDLAAERAIAYAHYYHAVGLQALVRGLKWAKPALARKVLADPRVKIYFGGREDIVNGRIDVRVLTLIEYLAESNHEVTVSCLVSGHRLYARPGVVSAHIYGLAVDISAIDNVPIAGHQERGGVTYRTIRQILLLPPEMQAKQVISLLNMGGPSFALTNHWDHIHVGYAPVPYLIALGEEDGFAGAVGSDQLVRLWQAAGESFGVPWQVLAAINKIESNFGQNMGPSSAGAIGWMQFMPSTWARWGMDANGDGVADPWNAADAIYSAARYLAAAGAATDLPRALYAYNHAQWYVNEVLELASVFGNTQVAGFPGGIYTPFTLSGDLTMPLQNNLRLLPDPPLSRYDSRAAGMSGATRGLQFVDSDQLQNGLVVLRDLIGTAQRSLPEVQHTVDLNLRSIAFHALANEPDVAYDISVRQSLADQTVISGLPRVLLPLGLPSS